MSTDTKEILGYLGLGLGALSLTLQFTGRPGTEVNQAQKDQELYRFSAHAISAARGTNICISWDCGKAAAPEPPAPVPVYYQRAEPGTTYVDQEGKPIPTFQGQDGQTYLVSR